VFAIIISSQTFDGLRLVVYTNDEEIFPDLLVIRLIIDDNDPLLGPGDEVEPGQLPLQLDAAISLPASLFQRINDRLNVGIFFAHYEIPSLFPVARESDGFTLPQQTVIGSDIIASTVGPGLEFQSLDEPVTILLRLQVTEEVVSRPIKLIP
jgi:hypothetical protein